MTIIVTIFHNVKQAGWKSEGKKGEYLRECELEAALLEAQTDLKENNVIIESVADHLARIRDAV